MRIGWPGGSFIASPVSSKWSFSYSAIISSAISSILILIQYQIDVTGFKPLPFLPPQQCVLCLGVTSNCRRRLKIASSRIGVAGCEACNPVQCPVSTMASMMASHNSGFRLSSFIMVLQYNTIYHIFQKSQILFCIILYYFLYGLQCKPYTTQCRYNRLIRYQICCKIMQNNT